MCNITPKALHKQWITPQRKPRVTQRIALGKKKSRSNERLFHEYSKTYDYLPKAAEVSIFKVPFELITIPLNLTVISSTGVTV